MVARLCLDITSKRGLFVSGSEGDVKSQLVNFTDPTSVGDESNKRNGGASEIVIAHVRRGALDPDRLPLQPSADPRAGVSE